ncbi:putative oligoribonuclease [Ptiloglossa arizonensis]|uniref:putative oligoribonuclease n=1 Tax=Ptiloglossa arizonensis TaxID=3350558 RepID=UPI003F9F15D2
MVSEKQDFIVWIDTELTGLDIEKDTILEIACVITDKNLKIVSQDFNVVINQPDEILKHMNDWNTMMHNKTGLVKECQCSKISLKEAEQMLLNFLQKYIPKQTCPLAGNTIYMDRMFLKKYMPHIDNYLHYRYIDVSSINELVRRWNFAIYKNVPEKGLNHRALVDIKESIEELKFYKLHLFICSISYF